MKKLQTVAIATVLLACSSIALAQNNGMGMMGNEQQMPMGKGQQGMGMMGNEQGMMMQDMQSMQQDMAQIQATKDPAKRQRLLNDHMQKMNGLMRQMQQNPMPGMQGGTMTQQQLNQRQQMMNQRMEMMNQMMNQMSEQNRVMMETQRMRIQDAASPVK